MRPWARSSHSSAAWAGVLALGSLTAVGCLGHTELMKPGAREVVFQLWGDAGTPPTVIHAEQLTQEGDRFDRLVFKKLQVRRPFDNGVIYLESPDGEYARREGGSLTTLEGPVHLSGTLRHAGVAAGSGGDPFVGVADRAVVHRTKDDNVIELIGGPKPAEQVRLLMRGTVSRAERMYIHDPTTVAGKSRNLRIDSMPYAFNQAPDAPTVALALAALPHPLLLPELTPGKVTDPTK